MVRKIVSATRVLSAFKGERLDVISTIQAVYENADSRVNSPAVVNAAIARLRELMKMPLPIKVASVRARARLANKYIRIMDAPETVDITAAAKYATLTSDRLENLRAMGNLDYGGAVPEPPEERSLEMILRLVFPDAQVENYNDGYYRVGQTGGIDEFMKGLEFLEVHYGHRFSETRVRFKVLGSSGNTMFVSSSRKQGSGHAQGYLRHYLNSTGEAIVSGDLVGGNDTIANVLAILLEVWE